MTFAAPKAPTGASQTRHRNKREKGREKRKEEERKKERRKGRREEREEGTRGQKGSICVHDTKITTQSQSSSNLQQGAELKKLKGRFSESGKPPP